MCTVHIHKLLVLTCFASLDNTPPRAVCVSRASVSSPATPYSAGGLNILGHLFRSPARPPLPCRDPKPESTSIHGQPMLDPTANPNTDHQWSQKQRFRLSQVVPYSDISLCVCACTMYVIFFFLCSPPPGIRIGIPNPHSYYKHKCVHRRTPRPCRSQPTPIIFPRSSPRRLLYYLTASHRAFSRHLLCYNGDICSLRPLPQVYGLSRTPRADLKS